MFLSLFLTLQALTVYVKKGGSTVHGACVFFKSHPAGCHGPCSRVSLSFTQDPLSKPFPGIYWALHSFWMTSNTDKDELCACSFPKISHEHPMGSAVVVFSNAIDSKTDIPHRFRLLRMDQPTFSRAAGLLDLLPKRRWQRRWAEWSPYKSILLEHCGLSSYTTHSLLFSPKLAMKHDMLLGFSQNAHHSSAWCCCSVLLASKIQKVYSRWRLLFYKNIARAAISCTAFSLPSLIEKRPSRWNEALRNNKRLSFRCYERDVCSSPL